MSSVAVRRAYNAAYYAAHPEKWRAYNAAYPEKRRAYNAAYRAAHPEKERAYRAAYRAAGYGRLASMVYRMRKDGIDI